IIEYKCTKAVNTTQWGAPIHPFNLASSKAVCSTSECMATSFSLSFNNSILMDTNLIQDLILLFTQIIIFIDIYYISVIFSILIYTLPNVFCYSRMIKNHSIFDNVYMS